MIMYICMSFYMCAAMLVCLVSPVDGKPPEPHANGHSGKVTSRLAQHNLGFLVLLQGVLGLQPLQRREDWPAQGWGV